MLYSLSFNLFSKHQLFLDTCSIKVTLRNIICLSFASYYISSDRIANRSKNKCSKKIIKNDTSKHTSCPPVPFLNKPHTPIILKIYTRSQSKNGSIENNMERCILINNTPLQTGF